MFKTNYHTHSEFCDGTGKLEDYVKSGVNKEFHILGFSGHAPLPFESDWTIPDTKLITYIDELKRLKDKYKEIIDIKTGLEVDYIKNVMGPADPFYKEIGLDFIIGSVHLLYDEETEEYLSIDYKKSEIEQLINKTFRGDARLLVKEYYNKIREMSEQKGFDIIGHLDVIKKTNINSIYFDETENWYKKEIKLTLQCISDNNQIIEINTGQIINDPIKIYPSPWILKIANEYNIPVMLNSDAHRPDRIDNYFDEAKKIIINAGYSELMVLTKGIWESDRIL